MAACMTQGSASSASAWHLPVRRRWPKPIVCAQDLAQAALLAGSPAMAQALRRVLQGLHEHKVGSHLALPAVHCMPGCISVCFALCGHLHA